MLHELQSGGRLYDSAFGAHGAEPYDERLAARWLQRHRVHSRNVHRRGTVTLQPGIYYGGLSLSGNATLSSGVYIMAGGGMTFVTGNSSITNTASGGIMIYNTQDPNPSVAVPAAAPVR